MALSPARLLRLYPGLWRARYGSEFLALLEKTPITRAVVIDVLRAAGREWIAHTRVGRLLLGCLVAQVATVCAYGIAVLWSPIGFFGGHRMDSTSGLTLMLLSLCGPMGIGSVLIILRTRRDRRFAWLGLSYQLAALFLSAVWAQWVGLGWHSLIEAAPALTWYSAGGCALVVTWMLLLLFNVDRSRESYFPWRGPASWVSSDRY